MGWIVSAVAGSVTTCASSGPRNPLLMSCQHPQLCRDRGRSWIAISGHLQKAFESGGEVDPDRAEAFVQRIESELQDLALRVAVIGDVARVGRIEGVGD